MTSTLISNVWIIIIIILAKFEVIAYVMLWYYMVLGWIAPHMAVWA